MLKKMLKINENPNDPSGSSADTEKKENSIPLSVEDIFAVSILS